MRLRLSLRLNWRGTVQPKQVRVILFPGRLRWSRLHASAHTAAVCAAYFPQRVRSVAARRPNQRTSFHLHFPHSSAAVTR
jgi:hypothetical protein